MTINSPNAEKTKSVIDQSNRKSHVFGLMLLLSYSTEKTHIIFVAILLYSLSKLLGIEIVKVIVSFDPLLYIPRSKSSISVIFPFFNTSPLPFLIVILTFSSKVISSGVKFLVSIDK